MKKQGWILLSAGLLLASCANDEKQTGSVAEVNNGFREKASETANEAQQTLMKNLTAQISANGIVSAIDFCGKHALQILDSVGKTKNLSVSRVSDKFRNPVDEPNSDDAKMISLFKNGAFQDTVVSGKSGAVYYKRINVAMPACLNCHGAEKNMKPEVLEKLKLQYPQDHARNYELGDFRGLWKIEE